MYPLETPADLAGTLCLVVRACAILYRVRYIPLQQITFSRSKNKGVEKSHHRRNIF